MKMHNLLLALGLFITSEICAQNDQIQKIQSQYVGETTSAMEYAILGWSSLFVTTYCHELGHAYMAKHFGAKGINVQVSLLGLGGRTSYRADGISNGEHKIITLSGLAVNRANMLVANSSLKYTSLEGGSAKWVASFYFANEFEILSQWALGIFGWTDFSVHAKLVSETYRDRAAIMTLWGATLIGDIYFSWNDWNENFHVLKTGQHRKYAIQNSTASVWSLQPNAGGIALHWHRSFN